VLVQPIFLFLIYFFVFGYLFAHKASTGPDVGFALYLFSGILAFTSFSESTNRSCSVVLENANLVKKVRFPCELLPVPNILVSLIVYGVGALVFCSVGLGTGYITIGENSLALPLVLVVHCVMCLGIGLILATLQVLLRDTSHLYTVCCQAWFFLTPVFWPYAMLEDKLGRHTWVLELNPMYPLVQAHRQALGFTPPADSLLLTHVTGEPLPGVWYHLGCASVWAFAFLVLGYSFFTSRKNKFADLV